MKSLLLMVLVAALLPVSKVMSQNTGDTIYVYHSDGRLHAFPSALVKEQRTTTKMFAVTAIDDTEYRYDLNAIDSVSTIGPDSLPHFEQFKFNNKYNDQVYQDVVCDISASNVITGSVPCIGKWLTPSFQLNDKAAVVYANGVQQLSKISRLKMDSPVTYTVTHDGWQVMRAVSNTVEEPEPTPEPGPDAETVKVELTVDMLSTNAPSNKPNEEGLAKLIDGDPNTFFHSTWGDGAYEKLPEDQAAYIDVKLPEALHKLKFYYANRHDSDNRYITILTLKASKNGADWQNIQVFTVEADALPSTAGGTFTSPTIDLGDDYQYLRFESTKTIYKNYLTMAELEIYKVLDVEPQEEEPQEEEPSINLDDYTIKFVPFGTDYLVNLDFPADRMTSSPAVYITTTYGIPPYSKVDYLDAKIRIDGAGVFPDMEETDVQIRGRGNSSWSTTSYSKNPYRLKFASKVKPFGLKNGKSWVLLANRQSGSMTSNAIGMKIAQVAGAAAANHIIPIDLYMNGSYWGSYNFTEKVGFSNNSIDIEDETVAARLELDTYTNDEEKIYYDNYYSLPIKIKEPDFSDETTETKLTVDDILRDFNDFMSYVHNKQDISGVCDVDTLAAFFLTNELIQNFELMHPKSTFLYKADYMRGSKYIWGPVWDLDWSYGYEKTSPRTYFQKYATLNFWTGVSMEKNQFMNDLRKAGEPLDRAIYKAWTIFMNKYLDEVIDYCDDYYAFAKYSLENNNNHVNANWSDRDNTNYATTTTNAKKWLRERAQYIYGTLTPYNIKIDEPSSWIDGYEAYTGDEGEDVPVGIDNLRKPTLFNVYDMRGVLLKRGATFDTFRDGLAPGIYIVNGKKVLIN